MNAAVRGADADADAMPAFADLGWDSDDRDDTWLISYADIISTALAMMVLLFGHRSLVADNAAAAVPVAAIVAAAAATAGTESTTGTASHANAGAGSPADPDTAMLAAAVAAAEALDDAESHDSLDQHDPLAAIEPGAPSATGIDIAAPSPGEQLAALVGSRFAGRIAAERRNAGVVLTIPAVALFGSARADLSPAALPLLAELTATLREVGEAQISVEGHTDDRPMQGGAFRSNWDLAAARANAVTAYLLAQGFTPDRLHSVSYADTRPIADNATPDGRAANRRVELAIDFEDAAR